MDFYCIRAINQDDVPFLWDMLYEIRSLRCVREEKIPSRDVLQTPDLAKYLQNWGLKSDRGFIALDAETPIGAAWYRLFTVDNRGYGYVNDRTPELAIALLPQYRNKGLGKSLLIHLFAQAKADGYGQISLSCAPTNDNALHLYQKLGFEQVGVYIIQNWIMKKVLN
ncbi:MAG: GNAT family N-acetyltransferase [Chroococcus sp. CMT-3BRIN-NPC107]|jgi:GNAT superfamily N-acetyltransferase|nr:GNAT family N-acetyltransferase [Chroococcus sp. CMT-3BRIN-NPC107]